MSDQTFSATWIETETTGQDGHDWVINGAPDEVTLEQARELCAANRIKARLSRPNGELVWFVDAAGHFQSA